MSVLFKTDEFKYLYDVGGVVPTDGRVEQDVVPTDGRVDHPVQGESVITLEAYASHVRSPASTAGHTSGTTSPLPIDRPTVEATLLLRALASGGGGGSRVLAVQ